MTPVALDKIEVRNVFKVFGSREKEVMTLLREGLKKEQVLAQTGCVVGVNDLSLSIRAGEVFVIMGLSGSGKSTLVRHLNRLIDPTSGQILVDGENILDYDMPALRQFRRHKISMVFQSFGLLPHRNVLENVAYGLKVRGESKAQCDERARHWISVVGLQGYEQAFVPQLSGGDAPARRPGAGFGGGHGHHPDGRGIQRARSVDPCRNAGSTDGATTNPAKNHCLYYPRSGRSAAHW